MTKKKLFILFINVFLIFLINLSLNNKLTISGYGSIYLYYSSFIFLCLIIIQKKIITPINILYATFILFQTGVPIAFFVKNDYSNFYMSLFSNSIIISAAKFTLWSIEAFSLTLLIFINSLNKKRKKILFSDFAAVNDSTSVLFVAKMLFIITSVIIVPLYGYVAILSIKFGFSQQIRSMVANNSFFNIIRAFFCPSFFLLICYGKDSNFTKIAKYIFVFICGLALVSGNRSDGFLWLITYFYFNQSSEKNTFFNKIVLFSGILILIVVAVYIGQNRMGSTSNDISSIFISMIGEMGFNFFSICFVMLYVPSIRGFLFGSSYLASFVCMLPKSLDFLHLLDSIREGLPAQWLYNTNHIKFGTLLDFGTGFSMIGESYMNFAWFGFLISAIYAFILCKVFNGKWNTANNWNKYVEMITFLGLLTFPRRGFIEFLNIISYSIFFLVLILMFFYRKKNI